MTPVLLHTMCGLFFSWHISAVDRSTWVIWSSSLLALSKSIAWYLLYLSVYVEFVEVDRLFENALALKQVLPSLWY